MDHQFDLVAIAKTINRNIKLILGITLLCGAVGAIAFLVGKKKYKATSEFSVTNPQFADRNNIFRKTDLRTLDYYGTEDDIDHVMAIANSKNVQEDLVNKLKLYEHYNLDSSKLKDKQKLQSKFESNYEVTRTEYKNVEVSFKDENAAFSADVVNNAVEIIENHYRGFYNNIKSTLYDALEAKIKDSDSMLVAYTDTLSSLRERFGIYSENSIPKGSNGGFAVEQIKNMEIVKSQLAQDKAEYISLLNEFSTGTKLNELKFVKIISSASPPLKPAGLGLVLTTLACMIAGFFITVIIVLIRSFYSRLIHS